MTKFKNATHAAVFGIRGAAYGLERVLIELDWRGPEIIFLGDYFGESEHEKIINLLVIAKRYFPKWHLLFTANDIKIINGFGGSTAVETILNNGATQIYRATNFLYSKDGIYSTTLPSETPREMSEFVNHRNGKGDWINIGYFDDCSGAYLGTKQISRDGHYKREILSKHNHN